MIICPPHQTGNPIPTHQKYGFNSASISLISLWSLRISAARFVQINFFFRLKSVNIAWNIEVKTVLFNFLHRRHMSVLVHVFTMLISLYDFVDVALTEDVLILSSFKVLGSVNEQDVIRITVALSFKNENTNGNTGTKEEICWESDNSIQYIQFLDKMLTNYLFKQRHGTEHREAAARQLARPRPCDRPCAARKQNPLCSSAQAFHIH